MAEGITATPLGTTSSGLEAFIASGIIIGTASANPGAGSTSAALAVANNEFFEFTITPPPGSKLNFAALVFEASRGGASTPRGWVVRSSVDGFGSDLATGEIPNQFPTLTPYSAVLPAADFTGIPAPVTFRIDSFVPASGEVVLYDNIQVLGLIDRPPVVSIHSPSKVHTSARHFKLNGVAFDDVAVDSVRANGKLLKGTNVWKTRIKLRKRVTKVRVVATDSAGLQSQPAKVKIIRTAAN